MPVSMPGSIPDIEAPLGAGATAPLDVKLGALRAKLPAGVQGAVKNVPSRVLFGALGAFGLVLVIGLLGAIVSAFSGPNTPKGVASSRVSAAGAAEPAGSAPKPAKEGPFARPDELNEAKAAACPGA